MNKKMLKCIVATSLVGLVLIAFITLFLFIPVSPEGRFRDDGVGCLGIAYLEFKNGKVYSVVPKDNTKHPEYIIQTIGTYTNSRGRWLLVTASSNTCPLKATIYGLEIGRFDGTWSEKKAKYPRIFRESK